MPVLQKLKSAYKLWFNYYTTLPKTHRYTLGGRIDYLFIETIEATSTASFLKPHEKLPYVRIAIRKLDTIKILLLILWETKSLDNKKYIALSEKISEVGRMLGGWHGQLVKQNSPKKYMGEK
ncbi:four helix bundle protein [Patescibacteria group bacterium]|nr:four helix bundle protein [Patescibacteria group bacterium]